jgi:sugar lactone lactonase YvrE
MTTAPEWTLAVDARNLLGEGPSWDPATRTLLWVDIVGCAFQRLDPATGRVARRGLDAKVSAVVPRAGGGLAFALPDGIWVAENDDGPLAHVAAIEADDPATRLNDAKCDPRGRLWVGSMADDERPGAGSLYRVEPGGRPDPVLTGLTISNGIAWSPDERRMYFIDSATSRVDVLDYDPATGAATGRRPLLEIPEDAGVPDGMTVDAEGCLWVATWDGWSVRRYTPNGRLDRVIRLPTARVTSCAFGGEGLSDLYVSTARHGLSGAQLAAQPLAGGLFAVRPGVGGLPAAPFAG